MIKTGMPISYILFKDPIEKLDKVYIWVQHANDFQDTHDFLITQGKEILASNASVRNFGEAMALISVHLVCNKLDPCTEYELKISGASICQVKNENAVDL